VLRMGSGDEDALADLYDRHSRLALRLASAARARLLGGLTQSELAARLGLPLGTIKSRTSAALRRLRTNLHTPEAQVGPTHVQQKKAVRSAVVTPAIQDVAS
jgi:DNA-binding NarL/FixJ family response regulator